VLKSLITRTLDYQAQISEEGGLVKDVKKELEEALSSLQPKEAAGNKSTSKRGQASTKGKLSTSERRAKREEIRLLRKEYRKRERGLVKSVIQKASIVVATCHGAGGRQLNGMQFDAVVIDEACQATEVSCWIPVLLAKADGKVILAGDHLQLPPTVKGYRHSQAKKPKTQAKAKEKLKQGKSKEEETSPEEKTNGQNGASVETEENEDGEEADDDIEAAFSKLSTRGKKTTLRTPRSLETTMFSRLLGLYGPGCKALLDVQYRMNEEIMQFPNTALYEGKIRADASCANIRLADFPNYASKDDAADDEEDEEDLQTSPLVFYDTVGSEMFESKAADDGSTFTFQSESKSNINEIEIVCRHVELLLSKGLESSRITILSPYNLQVRMISDHLRSLNSALYGDITVGSIDSMQGMEAEVVILSLVRSNQQRQVGFLAEKKRLNVAMTRAKRQLCIVGDSGTIGEANDDYLKSWMTFLEEHALIEPVLN
jgi:DNA polymerase alpha-associated DNA helicase A